MSREKQLIRREIEDRDDILLGTIIGERRPDKFDGTGPDAGVMSLVDVDIGSNNPLFNIPVKAGSDGGRFFANLGQVVELRKIAGGRYQVTGPGPKESSVLQTITYDPITQDPVTSQSLGFQRVVDPFEFYAGPTAMKGAPAITFALEAGDDTMTRDAGSFLDDGFLAGQAVRITSPLNSGTFSINVVSGLALFFAGDLFVDEGPLPEGAVTCGVVGTSAWNDGTTPFPSRRIVDAQGNTVKPSN